MTVLEEESLFSLWRDYSLSATDRDVLVWLYAPLTGAEALALYFSLDALATLSRRYEYSFNVDLAQRLNLTLGALDRARKQLEAVNLLETYRKESSSGIVYIYKLLPPATPKKFFADANIVLKGLLSKTMGEKYMIRARAHFAVDAKIAEGFADVSVSAQDIFLIDMDEPYYTIDGKSDLFPDKKYKSIEADFDVKIFNECLCDLQIDPQVLRDELPEIIRIAALYGVTEDKCAELAEKSLTSSNDFSADTFKNLAMRTVKYGVKSERIESMAAGGDTLGAFTVKKYENISPADFLADCTHATPIKSELQLLDDVSSRFGFSAGVINFILDYTLSKCGNKLPETFVLKVASTLKRSGVVTAYDAMASIYRSEVKTIRSKRNKKTWTEEAVRTESTAVLKSEDNPELDTTADLSALIGEEL